MKGGTRHQRARETTGGVARQRAGRSRDDDARGLGGGLDVGGDRRPRDEHLHVRRRKRVPLLPPRMHPVQTVKTCTAPRDVSRRHDKIEPPAQRGRAAGRVSGGPRSSEAVGGLAPHTLVEPTRPPHQSSRHTRRMIESTHPPRSCWRDGRETGVAYRLQRRVRGRLFDSG